MCGFHACCCCRIPTMNVKPKAFVCINCGTETTKLYHQYKDVIKILHCGVCGKVVDKYVEYDLVIISLDALLLKRQAFRHILHNSGIKAHWKFGLVYLICEAVTRLLQQSPANIDQKSLPDHVLYAALEVDLYWNFFISAIELLSTLCVLLFWTRVWSTSTDNQQSPVMRDFFAALLLSSFGKILTLPAMLWGPAYSVLYRLFGSLFTVAANIQTTNVLCPSWSTSKSCLAVLISHSVGYISCMLVPTKINSYLR